MCMIAVAYLKQAVLRRSTFLFEYAPVGKQRKALVGCLEQIMGALGPG